MFHLVAYFILGAIFALFGKALGLLTLLGIVGAVTAGSFELSLISPVLGIFNITNIYGQWIVAIVLSVSSIFADQ